MPQKRVPSPPKDPSPPLSSSSASSEKEEEGNHNTYPTSSQPPAKKPISDLNQTPNSDSCTEEEDNDEEEDSEDEKDVRSQSRRAQEKEDDEEEDADESGSDSDSNSDSRPPNMKSGRPSSGGNRKPISSKQMEGTRKPKKGTTAASLAPKPSPQKRSAAPDSSEKESKKRQKPDVNEEEIPKKPLFQRIWSTEDEISVLEGMIKYVKRGFDVSSDLKGFHKFVEKSLSVDVSKNQVGEKIRRMKRKYQNQAMKGKKPSFAFSKYNLVYELSKKLWGNEGEHCGNFKNTVKPKSLPPSKSENHNHGLKNIEVLYPHLHDLLHSGEIVRVSGFRDIDVKRAITLIGDSRAKEWDKRWMKLGLKEKDMYMERATLAYELMKELYDLGRSGLGMQHH